MIICLLLCTLFTFFNEVNEIVTLDLFKLWTFCGVTFNGNGHLTNTGTFFVDQESVQARPIRGKGVNCKFWIFKTSDIHDFIVIKVLKYVAIKFTLPQDSTCFN